MADKRQSCGTNYSVRKIGHNFAINGLNCIGNLPIQRN